MVFPFLLSVLSALVTPKTADGQRSAASCWRKAQDRIAAEARRLGDAAQGAVTFHQPFLSMHRKCHSVGSQLTGLGPILTRLPARRDGRTSGRFPPETLTDDPQGVSDPGPYSAGRPAVDRAGDAQDQEKVVLRDAGKSFAEVTIPRTEIETMSAGTCRSCRPGRSIPHQPAAVSRSHQLSDRDSRRRPGTRHELQPPLQLLALRASRVRRARRSRGDDRRTSMTRRVRARRADLQAAVHQLSRRPRGAGLAADGAAIRRRAIQERQRPATRCTARSPTASA